VVCRGTATIGEASVRKDSTAAGSAAQRADWHTESHCTTRLSCTATEWVISERIEALADGHKVFERERNARIPRDNM